MNLPPCSVENSILEPDLEVAIKQKALDTLQIMEVLEGYYVIVKLKWSADRIWYVTTRRERKNPKIYKDLNRLNEHLKKTYPTDCFVLYRNQKIPPK